MQTSRNEIHDMIAHEKMQVALEHQNEAWADGMADGIEPEIIADAAIALAMRETIRMHGKPAQRPCSNHCASACSLANFPRSGSSSKREFIDAVFPS